jgi:hypothetical protein
MPATERVLKTQFRSSSALCKKTQFVLPPTLSPETITEVLECMGIYQSLYVCPDLAEDKTAVVICITYRKSALQPSFSQIGSTSETRTHLSRYCWFDIALNEAITRTNLMVIKLYLSRSVYRDNRLTDRVD